MGSVHFGERKKTFYVVPAFSAGPQIVFLSTKHHIRVRLHSRFEEPFYVVSASSAGAQKPSMLGFKNRLFEARRKVKDGIPLGTRFFPTFGSFWTAPKPLLGPFWPALERSWALPGRPGAVLERSWDFGASSVDWTLLERSRPVSKRASETQRKIDANYDP